MMMMMTMSILSFQNLDHTNLDEQPFQTHPLLTGHGLLTVAMVSHSGNPVKELSYKKFKANVYTVTYVAEEKGEHFLTVQWGDRDVNGSPFTIVVN